MEKCEECRRKVLLFLSTFFLIRDLSLFSCTIKVVRKGYYSALQFVYRINSLRLSRFLSEFQTLQNFRPSLAMFGGGLSMTATLRCI